MQQMPLQVAVVQVAGRGSGGLVEEERKVVVGPGPGVVLGRAELVSLVTVAEEEQHIQQARVVQVVRVRLLVEVEAAVAAEHPPAGQAAWAA